MKSLIAAVATLALCGSALAATPPQPAGKTHGVLDTVRQDAHQIGSSFRQDLHRIARADKFRQQKAAEQRRVHSGTRAMGAGPENERMSSDRQGRMDAAYANWRRTHR